MSTSMPETKTKDEIIEEALMRIGVTDGTNEIGNYFSGAMDQWAKQVSLAFHEHKTGMKTDDWLEEDFDEFKRKYKL